MGDGCLTIIFKPHIHNTTCEISEKKTNEIFYEYGVWELVQGKRTDWDYVHELVLQGKTAYEIIALVPHP